MSIECMGGAKPAEWAMHSDADLRASAKLPEPTVLVEQRGKLVPIAKKQDFVRGPILGDNPESRINSYVVLGGKATLTG